MVSKTQIKKLAHQRVRELPKKNLHELVVEGCCGQNGKPNYRLVVQVTLTADVDGLGRFQATGVAYTNPMPYEGHPNGDAYDFKQGYRIARGEAELSLGLYLEVMDGYIPAGDLNFSIASLHEDQLVNAVYRTPQEIKKWRK